MAPTGKRAINSKANVDKYYSYVDTSDQVIDTRVHQAVTQHIPKHASSVPNDICCNEKVASGLLLSKLILHIVEN